MREKEAVEAERRNLARIQEKQAKTIEKLLEAEKNLQSQVVRNLIPVGGVVLKYQDSWTTRKSLCRIRRGRSNMQSTYD
jgi:diphthamide synthase (EF-2-diphthine--ammonia ligase)